MCVLALLPVWYYDMELTSLSSVLLLLSAYSMARGQEETSTSQAGRRRGAWLGYVFCKQHYLFSVYGGVEVILPHS